MNLIHQTDGYDLFKEAVEATRKGDKKGLSLEGMALALHSVLDKAEYSALLKELKHFHD